MKLQWKVDVAEDKVIIQCDGLEDDGTTHPIMAFGMSKVAFDAIVTNYKASSLWTPPTNGAPMVPPAGMTDPTTPDVI